MSSIQSNTKNETRRSSGPIRRTQSMPEPPVAPPAQHSLRKIATATPVYAPYSSPRHSVYTPLSVAYPQVNFTPNHEVYMNAIVANRSPIEQQRQQLEEYRRNKLSSDSNSPSSSTRRNRDAEAREIEQAIALSLAEPTHHANRYHSNSTEADPLQRTLLETTHMTPEELADEKALQEAILISIRDAALEQERILFEARFSVMPERSASTGLAQRHDHLQQHAREKYPNAHHDVQRRSGSTHRARNHHHQDTSDCYPSRHLDVSHDQLHHSHRAAHQSQEKAEPATFRRRDAFTHDDQHLEAHKERSNHTAAKVFRVERQHSQVSSPRAFHSHGSGSVSEGSSVVEGSNDKLSADSGDSNLPAARAPPPVFGHATLRAPPPLLTSDRVLSGVKHQ